MTDYTYKGTLIVYDDDGWSNSDQRKICRLAEKFLDHYSVKSKEIYVSNERDGFHITGVLKGFVNIGKLELKPVQDMPNGKLEGILLSESKLRQIAKIKIDRTVYLVDL